MIPIPSFFLTRVVLVAILILLPRWWSDKVGHLDAVLEEILLDRMRSSIDFDDGTIVEILAEERSVDRSRHQNHFHLRESLDHIW